MAEVTRNALRLLVVPDARTLLTTSGVSMTATSEAGPRPGTVDPAQSSLAVLSASGTLDGELSDLEFSIPRSGGPGDAEVRWRHPNGTTPDNSSRSWDPPSAISEWEFIDRSTTAGKYASPHACRRSTGLVVVVVTDASAAITCWRQLASGKWASSTVATVANSIASICELPSGRLVCTWLSGSGSATPTTQIQMGYSDDGGATWTTGSNACLTTPLAHAVTDVTRIRLAVLGSDLLLLLWGTSIDCYQYVSGDLGATFALVVGPTTGTSGRRCPDISVRNGIAYCGFIGDNAADSSRHAPLIVKLLTARTSIADAAEVWAYGVNPSVWTVAPAYAGAETSTWATGDTFAILADDDGTIWTYGRDIDGASLQETIITCSVDGGVTFRKPWQSSANGHGSNVTSWGTAASYLLGFCVVPERGRAMLIHTSVAGTATDDDSLMVAYLGGWTTVALPHDSDLPRMPDVGGWDKVWLAFEKPANVGWTKATAGAPTEVLGSSGMLLTCGGGESITYTATGFSVASAPNAGALFVGQARVDSGTATVDLRVSDGTHDFAVRLEVTGTGMKFWDVEAGGYVSSIVATTDPANGIVVVLCLDAPSGYAGNTGRIRGWYRAAGDYTLQGPKADRQWVAITGSTTLTRAATATSLAQFGQSIAGAGASCWRWAGVSGGTYVAGRNGLADPSRGRPLPDCTSPVHVEKGLRLALVNGPALKGETWTHSTAHDYPVEALDVTRAPSPSRGWRATDETQQDIVITCSAGWRSGDLVAIYLDGANFRTATLYQDVGLTKVADLDLGYGGLDYTRGRDIVYPSMSGTAGPWFFQESSCDGGTFVLSGGVRRRIRHAREGLWPDNAVGVKPKAVLELSGVVDGSDPASGTGELWMPRGLFLATILTSTNRLTLRIPAQTTADGHLALGTLMIGRACALASEYGWGHAREVATSVNLRTLRGGGRRSRQLAPNRRAVEIPFADGSDLTGLYTATAPSYVSAYTGGAAHGSVPSTLPLIAGLLDELQGSNIPGLLCLRMPTQGSAPTATAPIRVLDPSVLVYGRITTESWRRDNVLGEEGTDPGEVQRGGVLRIEQEI